ncbi:MAG: YHS domain-containing protein [Phycisphaerales bacterium]|nr:MAG: YHS domain-containing protein [Phycisphaerales bacterium]
MKTRSTNIGTILLATSILSAGLLMLDGCKKSEPAPPPTPTGTTQEMQGHEGHDHAAMMDKASEAAEVVTAALEQTTCPVMGGAINKDIFIEYQGKKVYFCCPGCEDQFKEEPEKYIAKLPQFQN